MAEVTLPVVHKAEQTLALIDRAIERDQGATYRKTLGEILPKMEDAYRADDSSFRYYFGISGLGKRCDRQLWLNHRWATVQKLSGQLLRLFNRGHLEEARFIAMLMGAGFAVYYEDRDGGQIRAKDLHGHVGSAVDGVVVGLPELPHNEPALLEFKTSGEKAFNKLVTHGVRIAAPVHYVQINQYMGIHSLRCCLYLSVNKNTDELYGEIVHFDEHNRDRFLLRAEDIIFSDSVPPRISQSSADWECRVCAHNPLCHSHHPPQRNCRTCSHVLPTKNGDAEWLCRLSGETLDREQQEAGCDYYELNEQINGKF